MITRRSVVDTVLVLGVSAFVFILTVSHNGMKFWEPWETSTLLAAQRMAQSSVLESSFWIPQVDNVFVAQPLLQLWFLALATHISSEIDPFWIRLPGALAGIFVVFLSFFAVRQVSTRRAAWMTVAALLTMPMFVLSGKLIHGDIWLILAVSTPQLFYLLAFYATTRRMHRTMLVFTGLSCVFSFLAGGLFALAILALSGALFLLAMRRHPQRQAFLKPLGCRYFIVSIFLAFVAIGGIFGTFVTQSRYALERRSPMTLAEINNALDNDNVVAIERRNQQIIGTVKSSSATTVPPTQTPFILVESHSNLNTNANEIFAQSESDRKTFINNLMWRFQKQTPIRAEKAIPDLAGSFENALRFFWFHTNSSYKHNELPLVRTTETAQVFADTDDLIAANTSNADKINILQSGILPTPTFRAAKGALLRILNDDKISPWIEVQNGAYERGYVMRSSVEPTASTQKIRWFSWIDILLYGLMPWACFCPIAIACLFASHKKLAISNAPFIGEFVREKNDASNAHSALQKLLLCWLLADLVALFVGVNQCNRVIFAGIVPTAILFGIAISAQTFWRTVRNCLEARVLLIVFAWGTLFFAMYSLNDEPYRIVRYLLTDPLMHWGQKFSLPTEFIVYAVLFACLVPVAFSGFAETIQNRLTSLRDQFKRPKREFRSSSSATLMRVSREEATPMPYAAAITFTLIAVISSAYIYHTYLPAITENLTEEALVQRYFELANKSEPVYLLSGENHQLCLSYRDCDPGYVCESSRCRISTFSSYSLGVAKPISRHNMLQALNPKTPRQNAFYIIPQDALFDINITYRHMFAPGTRKNLPIIDAPSSRLYLVGEAENAPSSNPMDDLFIENLPKEATKMQRALDEEITLEGFKIDKLDFESKKILTMTVYYRVTQKISPRNQLKFSFEIVNRKIGFDVPLLPGKYDATALAPSDVVSRKIDFAFPMMPRHDVLSVKISTEQSDAFVPITTIDF